jgi:hypothetical protein
LIDRYILDLDNQNTLSPDMFIRLVSATPKDKRNSYDKLMKVLLNLFRKGKLTRQLLESLMRYFEIVYFLKRSPQYKPRRAK